MIQALQAAIYQAGLLFLQKPNFALLIPFSGWTCLHEIITHGCQFTAVARVLLQHKAKYVLLFKKACMHLIINVEFIFRVNTTDFNQDTPLHASLLYHNTENTRLLLEHGANLELANTMGRKPIHNANDVESLELLLDHGAAIDSKDAIGNCSLDPIVND